MMTSPRTRFAALLIALGLLVLTTAGALAEPAVLRQAAAPVAGVDTHVHAAVSAEALAAEDALREAEGLPYRYALPVDLALTPDNAGSWETLPDGTLLWRLRLASPGALSLNVGCERAVLPPRALLHIYPADAPQRAVRLDPQADADHAQLWTPVLLADDVVLELAVPAADRPAVELVVSHLGRGYRFFGEDRAAKSGACNIDVVCAEGDAWRDEIDAVAMISIFGGELCTGTMVNNTAFDARPLFLTANHCGVNESAAPTLVAYWNYQTATCAGPRDGPLDQFTSGSTLLARYPAADMTLVELDAEPDPAYNVKYAGWDRSDAVPDGAVSIHHPSTDEKAISFEDDPLTVTFYTADVPSVDGNHLRVADWDLGTTEGGSSGAALFNLEHRVVGMLHGGRAACGNDLADWYGRFYTSWEGGGAADSRLSDHLDPLATGAVTVDLLDPQASRFEVSPADGAVFSRVDGGAISPLSATWTLAAVGADPVDFAVTADEAWLDINVPAGTLGAGGSQDVVVSPNAAALALSEGVYLATVTFANPDDSSSNAERVVELRVQPNLLSVFGPVPNPSSVIPVHIRCTLRAPANLRVHVTNIRGLKIRDLGTFAGTTGVNDIPWDGRADDGRSVPSGLYVVTVEGLGETQRTRLTLVR